MSVSNRFIIRRLETDVLAIIRGSGGYLLKSNVPIEDKTGFP